jgi:hypothetical protein
LESSKAELSVDDLDITQDTHRKQNESEASKTSSNTDSHVAAEIEIPTPTYCLVCNKSLSLMTYEVKDLID